MLEIQKKIESILFFKGEPVSIKYLSDAIKVPFSEIEAGIVSLKESMGNRGVVLMEKNGEIMLGTSPEVSDLIESIKKEGVEKDLTKAALETLSVILYRAPVSRSEIDFIRGVNSTFILRNLLIRGLIERKTDQKNRRSYVYEPTLELLAHLGVSSIRDLPEYAQLQSKIEEFLNSPTEADSQSELKETNKS